MLIRLAAVKKKFNIKSFVIITVWTMQVMYVTFICSNINFQPIYRTKKNISKIKVAYFVINRKFQHPFYIISFWVRGSAMSKLY